MDFKRKLTQWEIFFRVNYQNKVVSFFRKHFPTFFYWMGVKNWYFLQTGRALNYKKVHNINEKMMWMTRYWQHPLKTECADKYKVREYVKQCKLGHLLIPLINVYASADEINFNDLPQKFVLKCNHGSGFNIICTNKNNFDFDKSISQLKSWMNTDYSFKFYEKHYSSIQRKIVLEELLDVEPWEIQVYCINGDPDFLLVCKKCLNGEYKAYSYSLDWKRIVKRIGEVSTLNEFLPKPPKLDNLIKDATILARPFPFVRVDFYQKRNNYYFAEMTFTPAANVLNKNTEETIIDMGKKLSLPQKFI